MQHECLKSNIEFNVQINGNIYFMINNLIPQGKLETLIGDHIKDAIIAINSSDNTYRNIMVMLGIINNCYEFRVYDSGIEFEIETMLNLGIKPITTHEEIGGTGIGFISTFETLKECKASLIIEERQKPSTNNYTKAIIIRFDRKNEYKICSYRANDIKSFNSGNRIIVEPI